MDTFIQILCLFANLSLFSKHVWFPLSNSLGNESLDSLGIVHLLKTHPYLDRENILGHASLMCAFVVIFACFITLSFCENTKQSQNKFSNTLHYI